MPQKRVTLFTYRPQHSPALDRIDELRGRAVKAASDSDHQRLAALEADWNALKQRIRLLGADFVDPDEPMPTRIRMGYRELIQQNEAAAT